MIIYYYLQNTDNVIRNWISGKYSRLKVRLGWLPLHPTVYIKRDCYNKLGFYDESYTIAADTDLLVRYLYDAHLNVCYLNKYIVQMRMGGLSTDNNRRKQMRKEDIMLYRKHNLHPAHLIKLLKMAWKVPQFISAMLHKNRSLKREQDDKCFSKEIYDNAKIR